MTHDVGCDVEHVLGEHVGATPQQGEGTTGPHETERSAGARAVADELDEVVQSEAGRLAGGEHEVDRVIDHTTIDVDRVGRRLELPDDVCIEHLSRYRRAHSHALDDGDLFGRRRIAHDDLHEEAVALRLG